jgi:predicted RNase H-like HicB family nuclease
MTDYEISIFYSDEDSGYIAEIRDLPSCSAFGPTPADALIELEIARDAWLDAARADGRPIPQPSTRKARPAS